MLRKFVSELLGIKHLKTLFSKFLYLTGCYWIEQGSVWTEVTAVYSRSRFFVFTWVQDEAPLFLHVQWIQIKEFRFFAFCIRSLIQGQLCGNAPIDFSGFGSDFSSVVTGLKTNIFISLEFYWCSVFWRVLFNSFLDAFQVIIQIIQLTSYLTYCYRLSK